MSSSSLQSTLATAKLIIEFTKRLPGFLSLHQQDQVTLLKVISLLEYTITLPQMQKS
jgi:hypothetical protein